MEPGNITAYRAQAEKCSHQSDLTFDAHSKLHLLDLADAWLKLANSLEAIGTISKRKKETSVSGWDSSSPFRINP